MKTQKNFFKLKDIINRTVFFRIIKGLNDYNFQITITIELELNNSNEFSHETVDLIDEYDEILNFNDIYKTIEFIVLNGLQIDHVLVTKNSISATFYESIVHCKDGEEELSSIISKAGLNPEHWLDNATNGKHLMSISTG